MKYISVLIFVLLMVWTWSVSQRPSTVELREHKQVEANLEEFIRNAIVKQLPNVKDIIFRQLFTETVTPGQELNAFFRYDLIAPTRGGDTTSQLIDGSVNLKSTDNGQNWVIANHQVTKQILTFDQGSRISVKAVPTTAAPGTTVVPGVTDSHESP